MTNNIYDYVREQITAYKKPINITDGWDWSMFEHIRLSTLYKNSQFATNNDDRDKRPFKNIVRPILNIQYRSEGFDVKDIEIYVNNPETYWKSFLSKKYHEKWALDHEIDTFIDDLVESYVDYGGTLVKAVNGAPEVVNLNTIAFCDQTSILSGALGLAHFLSPQEIREQKEWGTKGATIDSETLISLAEQEKGEDGQEKNKTPGKYIQLYEVHGVFPDKWLVGREDTEEGKWTPQIHVIGYYKKENDEEVGVTLFSAREPKLPFKFLARDKINGRALGFGGIEELFEPQVWTNFAEVQIREMLELASKTFFKTTDQRFKTRNKIINAENGSVFDLQANTDINQLDTFPRNLSVFNDSLDRWEVHAQTLGAASDLALGEQPTAGTPFKSVEAQLIEGKSLHLWRRGKIAEFLDEIYREWVLPRVARDITKGEKFLSELSLDELQEISEQVAINRVNQIIKRKILDGETVKDEDLAQLKDLQLEDFLKGGKKKFIEIVKDEFAEEKLDIRTNIAGKQKNLALLTDKVVNVLRQFIATPEIRQDPEMLKLLNTILESSGMSPIMFSPTRLPQAPAEGSAATQPLRQLGQQGVEREPRTSAV